MPPKGRPRGGTRGRGGSAASARQKAAPVAPPEDANAAQSSESAGTPAQGAEENSAAVSGVLLNDRSVPDVGPLQPTESTHEPSIAPTVASASAPARPPVQRLDSLKNTARSSSRSASPATRGSSSNKGKKPLSRQPLFKGRRSKEERDELEREANERERAKRSEREAELRRATRGRGRGDRGRVDRGGRGRGGYMGSAPVSGPFSSGRALADQRKRTFGLGTGSRAATIKHEPGIKQEGDSSYTGRSLGTSIKAEDGGYISSDDAAEEAEYGPMKDIDYIELSSGEDEPQVISEHKVKDPARQLHPIRVGRKEHKPRAVGINTEASSATSAKILEQVEKDGMAPTVEAIAGISRKGKGKAKDIEITGERKPYKGMWQDEAADTEVRIKEEPMDTDTAVPISEDIGVLAEGSTKQPASPELEKKPRIKRRGHPGAEPALQTEEDKEEWARFQKALEEVRDELGPDPTVTESTASQNQDKEGDTTMQDAETAAPPKPTKSVRDDRVYLFQFPPVLPDLVPQAIKKERSDSNEQPLISDTNTEQTAIKVEEGADGKKSSMPTFSSGLVGKLRVHQSGRTTLNWGGTSFELKSGVRAAFLQETVLTRITPENERVNADDGGEAISFGTIRGKFVIVPDWNEMLG